MSFSKIWLNPQTANSEQRHQITLTGCTWQLEVKKRRKIELWHHQKAVQGNKIITECVKVFKFLSQLEGSAKHPTCFVCWYHQHLHEALKTLLLDYDIMTYFWFGSQNQKQTKSAMSGIKKYLKKNTHISCSFSLSLSFCLRAAASAWYTDPHGFCSALKLDFIFISQPCAAGCADLYSVCAFEQSRSSKIWGRALLKKKNTTNLPTVQLTKGAGASVSEIHHNPTDTSLA